MNVGNFGAKSFSSEFLKTRATNSGVTCLELNKNGINFSKSSGLIVTRPTTCLKSSLASSLLTENSKSLKFSGFSETWPSKIS